MNTMKNTLVVGFTALSMSLFSFGCGKEEKKKEGGDKPTTNAPAKPDPKTATPTPPKAPPPKAPEAPIADEDIPVAADFEEEVEKAVSADNYKDSLKALEAELAKEGE